MPANPPLALPTLTLAGSSPNTLLEANHVAAGLLRETIKAMDNTCPHPRDFQGRDADYQLALQQAADRIARVQKVLDEVDTISLHIFQFVK